MNSIELPKNISTDVIGRAVRRILRMLLNSGKTYGDIAKDANSIRNGQTLSADNIRKFVERPGERVNVSATLEALYEYIVRAKGEFEPFIKECVVLHTDVFFERDFRPHEEGTGRGGRSEYDFFVTTAYRLLARMLNADLAFTKRNLSLLEGVYACFRASTSFDKSERIVVSKMLIGPKSRHEEIVEFEHRIVDRNGTPRNSDGFVITLGDNVILIGDIELGAGLEMFQIRRPFGPRLGNLSGLALTLDANGLPTATRVMLIKLTSDVGKDSDFNFITGPQNIHDTVADFQGMGIDLKSMLDRLPTRAISVT